MVSVSTLRVALQWQPNHASVRDSLPQRRAEVRESGLATSADSQSSGVDLTEDLARRLEEDVDYQILRKTFDLEHKTTATNGSGVASGFARTGHSAADRSLLDLIFGQRVSVTDENAASQSRSATMSMDLSVASQGALVEVASSGRQTLDVSVEGAGVRTADPLVLDLSGRGLMTTGVARGVSFDLNGDGKQERISTVSGDTWLLALDLNANGRTDDGHELFGDQNGASHGFAELARYDDNADGVIDATDSVFASLRLVQLAAEGEERQQSLSQAKVVAIELGYQNVRKAIDLYDHVAQVGAFRFADGATGEAADLQLGYLPQE